MLIMQCYKNIAVLRRFHKGHGDCYAVHICDMMAASESAFKLVTTPSRLYSYDNVSRERLSLRRRA